MKHFVAFILITISSLCIYAEEDVQIVAQLNETKGVFVVTITNGTSYNIEILNQVVGLGAQGHPVGSFLLITANTGEGKSHSSFFQLWESSKKYDIKVLPIGKSITFTLPQERILGSICRLKRAQVHIVAMYRNPSSKESFHKKYWVDFEIVK